MKSTSLVLAGLASGSLAASVGPHQRQPRVVHLDTYKNPSDPLAGHFRRLKRDTLEVSLENLVSQPASSGSSPHH